MGSNPEEMIKKAISEELVEEMFRDLGFYVIKLGKEYAVSPLTQIEGFMSSFTNEGRKFHLERPDSKYFNAIDYVNKLPDFIILDQFGKVELLEVKYNYNATLRKKHLEVFKLYTNTILLVVNSYTNFEGVKNFNKGITEDELNRLKKTRFHIYIRTGDDDNFTLEDLNYSVCPIEQWLEEKTHGINCVEIIKKYEKIIERWLTKPRQDQLDEKNKISEDLKRKTKNPSLSLFFNF